MNDERETPQWLFELLDERFRFDLDPCATRSNAKCERYFTKKDDGLSMGWHKFGRRVFMNPPYSRGQLEKWCRKAYEESLIACLVVGLLPADHTTRWWQCYVKGKTWKWRIPSRINFGAGAGAKFSSVVVVWHGLPQTAEELKEARNVDE